MDQTGSQPASGHPAPAGVPAAGVPAVDASAFDASAVDTSAVDVSLDHGPSVELPAEIDVVIVGAGIAGLSTARQLAAIGMDVIVLEARQRLGGRIETVEVDGGAIDLGPTWYWPGETRVAALVDDLAIAIHDDWNTGDAIMSARGSRQRMPGPVTPPAFRFSHGVGSVVDALARALPDGLVRTGIAVERVLAEAEAENEGGELVVQTGVGSIRTKAAVVTIPPAVAARHGIITEAEVGSETLQIANATPTWMGTTAKVVAVYDAPFWRDQGLSGTAVDHDGPLQEIHDLSGPDGSPAALFGFAPVQPGQAPPTDEATLAQLVRLFGSEASQARQILARSWTDERWTSDGPQSGRYDLYGSPALTRPHADGRLLLASTETGTTAPGHLEGALQAAERAVDQLIRLLVPG